ncbi:MAG: D-alanyl-D-alanine dipeptidase [Pseudomonadota bacterium]|nr:D-alanyl-D-alanine dipeptidase [Pseudomonadota bacterium]
MKNDLVNVKQKNADVIIDLRYASENNFTSQKIFNSNECYIHNVAFEHLCKSIEISKKLGYKLKIFDAYRPVYVQKALWNKLPDPNFIAPPEKGSPHSRGVAIDLTLTRDGEELDMGTEFDEFSRLSYHGNLDISKESYENRLILLGIMTDSGWDFFRNEWWHYQLFNSKTFPIIDDFV